MNSTFKTALISAVVAAFVAAGAAVATTQAFTLGTTNRVDAATKVTNLQSNGSTVNPVDGPILTLENKSATANATPLSLLAAPGRPALKVNNQVKVASLNADLLDGIDSSGFVQGKGTSTSATLIHSADDVVRPLLTLPKLGSFTAQCRPLGPNLGELELRDPGSTPLYVTILGPAGSQGFILPGSNSTYVAATAADTVEAGTVTLWQISPEGATTPVADVVTSIMFDAGNCVFRASAVVHG